MESLGSFLKETREKLGYTIEKAAEETRISAKYISDIESDLYSGFPGEAYIKGFLRSYSQFLELEPDKIVRKYELIKISESEMPIDKLIPKPSIDFRFIFSKLLIVLIVCGIGYGIFMGGLSIYRFIKNRPVTDNSQSSGSSSSSENIAASSSSTVSQSDSQGELLTGEKTLSLNLNSIVGLNIGGTFHPLKVIQLFPTVILEDATKEQYLLFHNYSEKLDINNDSLYDVQVKLNNWNDQRANITFIVLNTNSSETTLTTSSVESSTASSSISSSAVAVNNNSGHSEQLGSIVGSQASVTLNVKRAIYVRYKADNNQQIEQFFSPNTSRQISFSNSLTVWSSDAGGLDIVIQQLNKTISAGPVGTLSVKRLVLEDGSDNKKILKLFTLN